jgi:hypothetical protein
VKRTKLFSLLTVPAAARVKPSSKRLSPLRALAGLFVLVLVFGLGSLAPLPSYAGVNCGGAGQRACCVPEQLPSCNPGFHEVPGCTGDCKCGGFNPGGAFNAIGHCEANPPPPPPPTACGGAGQRACCVIERPGSPCNPGLQEVGGCSGNCTCGGPNPGGLVKSSSQCTAPIPCGGAGQRACCVIERPGSPCNAGLQEVPGCSGNCTCGGPNPGGLVKSSGTCAASTTTTCGGNGQRACCVIERPGSPCNAGLQEVGGCSGNCTCGGVNPGGLVKSSSQCTAPIPCGGNGQRACCVIERPGSPCNAGLQEVGGCSGNCTCGGVNPGGLVKSSGHCAPAPATTQQPSNSCSAALANLNSAIAAVSAANQAVQQQCGAAGGAQQVAPTTKQNVGGPGGLPAPSVAPSGLQRPGSLLPAPSVAPSGLQRPVTK